MRVESDAGECRAPREFIKTTLPGGPRGHMAKADWHVGETAKALLWIGSLWIFDE